MGGMLQRLSMHTRANPYRRSRVTVVLVVLLTTSCTPNSDQSRNRDPLHDDTDLIADAFARRQSGLVVESSGTIVRVLDDDTVPPRHQRFIVRLRGGQTVLISHNLDLAKRVPVEVRKQIAFRGQYEWNDRGGVIHWTHHDPDGQRRGGWLEYEGRRYR